MSDGINIQIVEQLDRGLSYAESCFETFRVINGQVFAWEQHWNRLQQGLNSFGIHLPHHAQSDVYQACLNHASQVSTDALMRLTVSGGQANWGLEQQGTPNIFIQAQAYHGNKGEVLLQSVESPFPALPRIAKFSSDYALSLRAQHTWNLETPAKPLVCQGNSIIGGITANITLWVDGMWLTPNHEAVLKGTVRQFLIDEGLLLAVHCPTSFINQAEATLLLNSGSFMQVVQGINGKLLDTNHPALQSIQQTLSQQQGIVL